MTSPTALVLGGTGFVGAHVCAGLHDVGYHVVSVSRPHTSGHRAGGAPSSGARTVRLDLAASDTDRLRELVTESTPAVVVNAAGLVWEADEQRMWELNARFVERLVAAVSSAPARAGLVHLGSAYEYGPGTPGVSAREDGPAEPLSAYGRTKIAGTRTVLEAGRRADLSAVVLRAGNVIGPGAPEASLPGLVAHRLARIAAHRPGAYRGAEELRLTPLRATRDFVDARDVASAVVRASEAVRRGVDAQVVNVARGEAVPVRRVVEELIAASGLPVRLVERPVEETAQGAARTPVRGGPDWQRLDVARARKLLGWRPVVGLEESLADLLAAARLRGQERVPT